MQVRVRPATAADAEIVAELARALNEHEGEPAGNSTAATLRRDGLGRADAEFSVLVAELDGVIVGYALYHNSYSTEFAARGLYLYDLFVTDAARGRGAGRALVAALARLAKTDGRSFLWWCSKAWNKDAQAFYHRLGAVEEDIKAHAIWGDDFDRLAQGGEVD